MDGMDKVRPYPGRVVIILDGETLVPEQAYKEMLEMAQKEGRDPSAKDVFLPSSKAERMLSCANK